jgi:hypothetical protein
VWQVFRRKGAETGGSGADFGGRAAVFQPPDALRPEHDQPFAVQVEVHQSEVRAQPVVVFRDPAVSRLVEAEDAFQYSKHMFYFRSYFRLRCVLAPGFFVKSSRPEESHLQPLTEPCLNLSIHTALRSPAFASYENKPSLKEVAPPDHSVGHAFH